MADELVDICDDKNTLLGIQKMKSEAHAMGLWHRAAHIWMYNSAGDILLQLRAKNKPLYPDMWDISAAGHVSADEAPIVSAIREVEEEIGISVTEENLHFTCIKQLEETYEDINNKEFCYMYFFQYNGDPSTLTLQQSEVAGIEFWSPERIVSELDKGNSKLVPHGRDYWQYVLDTVRRMLNIK